MDEWTNNDLVLSSKAHFEPEGNQTFIKIMEKQQKIFNTQHFY